MEEIVLTARARAETGRGKVKALRDQGFVPAVVYSQGKEALALKVSHKELMQLIHQYRIESVIINLRIDDEKQAKDQACLIKEIQYDPVQGDVWHVDFNRISLTEALKVNVPVLVKGEAVGVKQEGGSLEHILWEIEVECLPTDIPKGIEVDITNLKMGDSIHIKDITPPAKVKILNDPEAMVLSVASPMKEAVAAEPAAEGEEQKEPEVIKEKKEPVEEAPSEEKK